MCHLADWLAHFATEALRLSGLTALCPAAACPKTFYLREQTLVFTGIWTVTHLHPHQFAGPAFSEAGGVETGEGHLRKRRFPCDEYGDRTRTPHWIGLLRARSGFLHPAAHARQTECCRPVCLVDLLYLCDDGLSDFPRIDFHEARDRAGAHRLWRCFSFRPIVALRVDGGSNLSPMGDGWGTGVQSLVHSGVLQAVEKTAATGFSRVMLEVVCLSDLYQIGYASCPA